MTDEITQNDCHGEQMYSAEIPINIELGSAGLYYGTSPQMKGLLVTGHTIKEVMDRVPNAIAEMRAVAAMGPEIASLREQLTEARAAAIEECIQALLAVGRHELPTGGETLKEGPYTKGDMWEMFYSGAHTHHAEAFKALRSLKGETDDAN